MFLYTQFIGIYVTQLHDGEKCCITTLGRVRRKEFQRGPGVVFYYAFEEIIEDIANSEKLTSKLTTKINRKVKKYGCHINEVVISDARPHEFVLICNTTREVFGKK